MASAQGLLSAAQLWVHGHPRRFAVTVAGLLAASALTAYGIAPLTSFEAQVAPPPLQQVEQELPLPPQMGEAASAAPPSFVLYRSDVTRSADTIDTLFRRLGVDDGDAAAFLRSNTQAMALLQGRSGRMVRVTTDNGHLLGMVVRGPAAQPAQVDTHFTRLTVERQDSTFHLQLEQVPLGMSEKVASGTISSSLYAAADEARMPDAITNQVAEVFSTDIDFRRELRKGDAFTVVYESLTADGEPITWNPAGGRVLAARFINQGKVLNAVWFAEAGRKGAYFDLNGRSKVKSFLAAPLAFSRVTSGFAMRFHPIQHTWKAHLGVDYGAPTGTPVRVVGDGVVSFAGVQNGYGNVVQIQHSGDRSTVYAHLSRIDVRKGQRVEQGQTLGAVGSTGWATGPHLHFEFKTGGRQVDPVAIARASETLTLSSQSLVRYRVRAQTVARSLEAASQIQSAGARSGPTFE